MKKIFLISLKQLFSISIVAVLFTACAPQIELTSSWTNKTVKPKKSPKIMVMVMGEDLNNRMVVENDIVNLMKAGGHNAIAALDVFKPNVQKYDSATMVNMLRQNNIDMLLTNSIVNISEKERYVPGTTEQVPVGTYATPYNPYYNSYYNNYYNYYNYQSTSYQTIYETRTTPGYTVTDVEVIIESNLYDVSIPELLWFGQSKSYTKEPSTELFHEFATIVVNDITKNNLLVK
jgi:hypothetical protein